MLTKDFSASAPAAHPAHRVLEGNATHWHEQYEERIAIRQHDGELPIEEAIYLSRWATLHQFVVLHHPSVMAEFETAINQPVRH
ncbi:MAG: hypothetical protein P8P30_04390 [Rickettsiales bacterium]|nr:hypothetical protein [Rickettsiales bacterium]